MIYRFSILCLGFWLLVSGVAGAALGDCRAADMQTARHVAMTMPDDCDMPTMQDRDPAPADGTDMPEGAVICCCPVIPASLPTSQVPEGLAAPFPPSFDTLLGESATSYPSVPEPPPPRA